CEAGHQHNAGGQEGQDEGRTHLDSSALAASLGPPGSYRGTIGSRLRVDFLSSTKRVRLGTAHSGPVPPSRMALARPVCALREARWWAILPAPRCFSNTNLCQLPWIGRGLATH